MTDRTAIVLFSGGANGWELALHRAGVHVTAACEADPWRREVTAKRWSIPVYDDVRTLTAARLETDGIARPWGLFGSPPCQDASEVNSKGKGLDGEQTGLFFEALRLGAEFRPAVIGLENVDRLRHRGLDRLCLALERIGYLPRPIVVGAGAAGLPHQRQRIWLMATDATGAQGRPTGQPRQATAGPAAGRLDIGRPEDGGRGIPDFGPEAIGRHLRGLDDVPDRLVERVRCALGDAVVPLIPFLIVRGLIAWEDGLADCNAAPEDASARGVAA